MAEKKVVAPQGVAVAHGVAGEEPLNFAGQLGRDPLIRIDDEHPLVAGLRTAHVDAHRHPHDVLDVHEPVQGQHGSGRHAAHRCAWSTADCSDWM